MPFTKTNNAHSLDDLLKTKYLAKEIIDENFLGLGADPFVNTQDIVNMYTIFEPSIIDDLLTPAEKAEQVLMDSMYNCDEKIFYNIIIESKDGETISGYTTQGNCIKLSAMMHFMRCNIFTWDALNLEDIWYVDYLAALWWAGFFES